MDYEKKYKDALERAKDYHKQLLDEDNPEWAGEIENIFPELAESEDEKIRKALLEYFGEECDTATINGIYCYKIYAWLEKQGSTNETIDRDKFAQSVLKGTAINLITWIDYNAAEGNICLSNVQCKEIENALVSGDWNKIYAYMKKKLERQGEQKPVDMVEPKFNVGDWCIDNEDGVIFQIVKVLDNTYTYKTNEGKEYSCTHYSLENDARLWTIQDAKDGDVLVANIHHWEIGGNVENFLVRVPTIFIYQKVKTDKENIHAYVSLFDNTSLDIYRKMYYKHEYGIKDIHPATKEQRELLFQEIRKAGYEWDDETKELRGIEEQAPKSKWSDDDEQYLLVCKNALRKYQVSDKWDADIISKWLEDKLKQGKPKWTEEDKEIVSKLQCTLNHVDYDYDTHKKLDNWLKSIEERMEE